MDLNTIEAVLRPAGRSELPRPGTGDAFLAGGTWLFSEPQTDLRRLVDLAGFQWPPLRASETGLEIAATCTFAQLEAFAPPPDWRAAPLFAQSAACLLGSFKIRRVATVGGNLCLALPAAPMAALAVALHATCTIWRDGQDVDLPALDLITGANETVLQAGDVLRALHLPADALRQRAALRQASLTQLGRSAALLIATQPGEGFELTITAATSRPYRLHFATMPKDQALADAIDGTVGTWLDDVHGRPDWRRRMTHLLAAELAAELRAQA